MEEYKDIVKAWNINWVQDRSDLDIAGSPERTVRRAAFEGHTGRSYILEQIDPDNVARKKAIAQVLQQLHEQGLEATTPYMTAQGASIIRHQQSYWMLRPYVDGAPLNRATYGADAWRGDVLTDFLIQLQRTSQSLPALQQTPTFSLPAYTTSVLPKLDKLQPGIAARAQFAINFLNEHLFPIYDSLPTAFCHGDYHPLNVIWGKGCIKTVIDWEFCGNKPELYDVALLLGCLGFDEPDNLTGPLAERLIQQLSTTFHLQSWKYLIPLMIAIRIAWLREWVVRQEEAGLEQELTYLQILIAFFHEEMLNLPA